MESVYISQKFPIAHLYFDEDKKCFKLHVSDGEDYVTVDLSKRDKEYAKEAIELISLLVGDY